MKRTALSLLGLLLIGSILAGLVVPGICAGPEFSADITMSQGKNRDKLTAQTGRMYVKGDKIRQEFASDQGSSIAITRIDKGITWLLMPESKTYMEMAFGKSSDMSALAQQAAEMADKQVLGTETVSGYQCEKIQYTYRDKQYGVLVQWMAKSLGWYVKMEHTHPKGFTRIELTNIKQEKLADSLFELPDGYQKLAIPGFGSK